MKRVITLALCLLTTNCTFVDNREQAKEIASRLETSKDVLTTIDTYNTFYGSNCFSTRKNERTSDKYGVYNCDCNRSVLKELSQPKIDLGCMYKNWATDEYYNSDKCITQRRKHPASNSGFFDYKRFLPKDNNVNTEENWVNLAGFYKDKDYCESEYDELTTSEKQACTDFNKKATLQLAISKTKPKCRDVYKARFDKAVREFIVVCAHCNDFEAVKNAVYKWGEEHLCSIDNEWDAGLNDLAFYNRH